MVFILPNFLLFFCSLRIRNFTSVCEVDSIANRL
jgi:hypothetical protein